MRRSLTALTLLLAGCSTPLEPREEREIGVILGYGSDDPQIVVPDSTDAGGPFEISVTTYGNSCVRKGETELVLAGDSATLTPYDYTTRSDDINCADLLRLFEHSAVLRFDGAGTAYVLIRGREEPSGELVTVVREVIIR